jgi:hypothetical protein
MVYKNIFFRDTSSILCNRSFRIAMLIEPDRGHQTSTMRIKIDRGTEPLEPFSQPQGQGCGQNCDGWITNITSALGAILRHHKGRLLQAPTSAPLVATVQQDFRTALSGILLGVLPPGFVWVPCYKMPIVRPC